MTIPSDILQLLDTVIDTYSEEFCSIPLFGRHKAHVENQCLELWLQILLSSKNQKKMSQVLAKYTRSDVFNFAHTGIIPERWISFLVRNSTTHAYASQVCKMMKNFNEAVAHRPLDYLKKEAKHLMRSLSLGDISDWLNVLDNRLESRVKDIKDVKDTQENKHFLTKLREAIAQMQTKIDQIQDSNLLGKGSFGEVVAVKQDEKMWAVKQVKFWKSQHVLVPELIRELYTLTHLSHAGSGLIKCESFQVIKESQTLALKMELATDCLYYLMHERQVRKWKPQGLVHSVQQLLAGLATLHSQGVAQFDLKPSNILVFSDGRVTLADFGSCVSKASTALPCYTLVVTYPYRAPELRKSDKMIDLEWADKADMFSLGVVLIELLASWIWNEKEYNCQSVFWEKDDDARAVTCFKNTVLLTDATYEFQVSLWHRIVSIDSLKPRYRGSKPPFGAFPQVTSEVWVPFMPFGSKGNKQPLNLLWWLKKVAGVKGNRSIQQVMQHKEIYQLTVLAYWCVQFDPFVRPTFASAQAFLSEVSPIVQSPHTLSCDPVSYLLFDSREDSVQEPSKKYKVTIKKTHIEEKFENAWNLFVQLPRLLPKVLLASHELKRKCCNGIKTDQEDVDDENLAACLIIMTGWVIGDDDMLSNMIDSLRIPISLLQKKVLEIIQFPLVKLQK